MRASVTTRPMAALTALLSVAIIPLPAQGQPRGDASVIATVMDDASAHTRPGRIRAHQREAGRSLHRHHRPTTGSRTAATPTGSISGTISGADGVRQGSIRVEISVNGQDWHHAVASQTGGSYRVPGVADGQYFVRYSRIDPALDYVQTHLRSGASLRRVKVTGGRATGGVNVTMAMGSTLTGSLRLPTVTGTTPADQVFLAVYPVGGTQPVQTAYASPHATSYAIHGVPRGRYRLAITGLGRVNVAPTTRDVTVAGDVSLPVVLQAGARISGRLLTSAGAPATGQVVCFEAQGNGSACEFTDATGAYTINSLPTTTGVVTFSSGNETVDDAAFFPGVPLRGGARTVNTTTGTLTTLPSARMPARATVTGIISGAPVDPFVSILDDDGRIIGSASGRSYTASVPATTVRIYAGDYGSSAVGRWWNGTTNAGAATRVSLAGGSRRAGVDLTLNTGGGAIISSTVPTYLTRRYPSLHVSAMSAQGDFVKGADVTPAGGFTLRGLAPGTYTLSISNLATSEAQTVMFDARATMTVTAGAHASGVVWRWPSSSYQDHLQVGTPMVSGTPRVGGRLSVAPGSWVPFGNSFRYQWLADGRPIQGATGSTLVVPSSLVGSRVTVQVTGSQYLYRSATRTAAVRGVVQP